MGSFNSLAFDTSSFYAEPVQVAPLGKFTFLAASRIVAVSEGVVSFTAQELYSAWKVWATANSRYLPAFRVVGGDPIGGGIFVAAYYFLTNGWQVRPQEVDHTLVISGNLVSDTGTGVVAATLGQHQVLVQLTVPVQAQGISTSGSTGPTAAEIAAVVIAGLRNAPIPVNMTQVRGQPINGAGTQQSPWGP